MTERQMFIVYRRIVQTGVLDDCEVHTHWSSVTVMILLPRDAIYASAALAIMRCPSVRHVRTFCQNE